MKNLKMFLVAGAALASAGVFAGELPSNPTDWPAGLDMTAKMLFLVMQIGVILFAAKIGGAVAGVLKLPSVLGELGAGVVIGPWALGGLPIPGFNGLFSQGLFFGHALQAQAAAGANPFAATPELYGVCTIASVVLLFLSGIETNLKMFIKYAFAGSLVGVGGVVFSFIFGDLAAVYATTFLPDMLGGIACLAHLGELVKQGQIVQAVLDPAAMFMGIMSTATSVGITARILSEKKKMDSEEGVTIMAGAVIDDVLGIIVLAIGMGIIASQQNAGAEATGVKWGEIGKTAASAFGVWLGGTLLGVIFARKISWLLKNFRSPVAIATLAFGLSLIIAGAFEALGLTLIIGAYVMGLALSRTDIKHLIQENLQSLYTFFVPVFFCVMGMMVDVSALCSKPVLVFGGIYTVLAVVAKVLGCAIPSLFCGFNTLGALRVGAGMIPRGEVALIIAGIGLANGYLTQEVFGIGILMTLVTTVVAPPALVGLFLPAKRGVRHVKKSNDTVRQVLYILPDGQVAGIMARKLVQQFAHEGFYTTLLTNDVNLCVWNISKDAVEIGLTQAGSKIRVECTPEEEAVVHQAWMEVVGDMNALAQALTKPVQEREEMEKLISMGDDAEGPAVNEVARHVQNFVMIPSLRADSKEEAIDIMTEAIQKAHPQLVKNLTKMRNAVRTRENAMPTGLDLGLAVPHGRTDAVSGIVGAIALVDNSSNPNGTIPDYDTIDHSAVQIIVLTVAPESASCPYLQLMAFLIHRLRRDDVRPLILKARTAEEMRKYMQANLKLK